MLAVLRRLREVVGQRVPATVAMSTAAATYDAPLDYLEDVPFTISPWARIAEIWGQQPIHGRGPAVAFVVSTVLHMVAIVLIAEYKVYEPIVQLTMELHAAPTPPEEELKFEPDLTLAPASDDPSENALASIAMSLAPIQSDTANLPKEALIEILDNPTIALPEPIDMPLEGATLSQTVVRAGRAGEEVFHVDGAVDRITHEIVSRLEMGPVLVVWVMDQSISQEDDRAQVAARLEKVFKEIGNTGKGRDAGLLNAVLSFGQGIDEIQAPTSDGAKVITAMKNVPNDPSGVENVFTALITAIDKYKPMFTVEHRQTMCVIWTDESGDDYLRVDEAVKLCQRHRVPVFTVGPSAMFGRQIGTHAYKNPEDGITYQLPVFRGPDSAFPERIALPYWFEGPQYETLHSGLGPFALTRLATESGGVYFINDAKADRSPFSVETMRPYMPSYSSAAEYLKNAQATPLRKAILQAVELTHALKFRETPELQFAPTGTTYITDLRDAQKLVAYNLMQLDQVLPVFGKMGMEEEYSKEKSPRWRAWYDLNYGRLLAMYVRCNEYNWACAEMKGKGADFVNKQSNRWNFVPDPQIRMGSSIDRVAQESTRLLKRCATENVGTPWEVLAQRELRYPLGFKIEESYVAPPPPPMARPAAPANPPPPPPPPTRREEQLKMLAKPKPVILPKL